MRDDMARVIVERPRIPDFKNRKGRPSPLEELPHYEGMRRPHLLTGEGKTLNENLQPLRRCLERQVAVLGTRFMPKSPSTSGWITPCSNMYVIICGILWR